MVVIGTVVTNGPVSSNGPTIFELRPVTSFYSSTPAYGTAPNETSLMQNGRSYYLSSETSADLKVVMEVIQKN
jgi:hypothetical protein